MKLLLWLLFFTFNFLVGGFAVQYVIEYWASLAKDQIVDFPFIVAGFIGLVFGELAIPAAIITFIISFFI